MLARFGITRSRVTLLIMVGLLFQGVLQYRALPKLENPAITIRTVVVTASAPGMAPERVETLLAVPIERAVRELAVVGEIRTQVRMGVTIVNVNVRNSVPQRELVDAFQEIRNRVSELEGTFPDGARGPFVNTNFGDVVVATVAVTGEGFGPTELEVAAKLLQSELYTVAGTSKVTLLGVQDERVMLEFDARKLAAVGVQLPELIKDLRAQNVVLPAGELDAGGTRLTLEASGDLRSLEDIENVLTQVVGIGGTVRLADLLDVRRAYEDPPNKPVWFNGQPAVMVAVEMADGEDIQDFGKRIREVVYAHETTQPIGISYGFSTYQETKVTSAINGALSNVGQTFFVVLVVMLVFLSWRPALIIASIVPLSVAFALLGMSWVGVALEQISIAAVIISMGLLVDNGLVVVEDIQSRIDAGAEPENAAAEAGKQFFLPLAVASITTVSAFLPMMILDGTEGEFAFSLGAVVGLMLAGSWLVSMYILPALCAWFAKRTSASVEDQPKKGRLGELYARLLSVSLPFCWLIIAGSYVAAAGSVILLFPKLESEMFPLSERNQFLIYMDMPKGTAISRTADAALDVERWLSEESTNPEVTNTTLYVGDGGPRFYLSLSPADVDPASAFFLVNTATSDGAVAAGARARQYFLERHPEARFKIKRLSMGGSESGIVKVELEGPGADELMHLADSVEGVFAEISSVVQNENDWGNKVLTIGVDVAQDKARALGVTSESLSDMLDGYFSGVRISDFREGDDPIPIILRSGPSFRDSIEDLQNVTVLANGGAISLDQVATIDPRLDYSSIRRIDQQRRITVTVKADGMTAERLLDAVQPKLDALKLLDGYTLSLGGETKDSAEVNAKLAAGVPIALMIMLIALTVQFNSARRVTMTLMTVPLILIGAPMALLLSGRPLSFFAILGMISLAGIIINNAIVLIDQIDLERKTASLYESIIIASGKRVKPIMLTSLTTVCGLLPMAIAGGVLFEPMATLMIGGLIVGSLTTLVFVPAAYYGFFRAEGRMQEQQIMADT
ncbi:MAG: multidrug efflux pump subunit AcrB [Granulosicoccus sp.]